MGLNKMTGNKFGTGCSFDQGSLCPINQLFCLPHQALHRPPPAPMKEHRLSPMREEPLSVPVNEEGSQNVGGGAAGGCPPGTVGSTGSNKKPRSRTKVETAAFSQTDFLKSGPLAIIN